MLPTAQTTAPNAVLQSVPRNFATLQSGVAQNQWCQTTAPHHASAAPLPHSFQARHLLRRIRQTTLQVCVSRTCAREQTLARGARGWRLKRKVNLTRNRLARLDSHGSGAAEQMTRLTKQPLMTMLSMPQTGRYREMYVSVGYQPGPTPSTQFSLRATEIATTVLLASAYTALWCTATTVLSSRTVSGLCTPSNVDERGNIPR